MCILGTCLYLIAYVEENLEHYVSGSTVNSDVFNLIFFVRLCFVRKEIKKSKNKKILHNLIRVILVFQI